MSDDAVSIMIMVMMAMTAYIAYVRLFVVRRLRKRLDQVTDGLLSERALERPLRASPDENGELQRMQERLRVLERIAVEKEDTLSREIDELRAGRA